MSKSSFAFVSHHPLCHLAQGVVVGLAAATVGFGQAAAGSKPAAPEQGVTLVGAIAAAGVVNPKTFIDYFLPTPLDGPLSSTAWGAPNVLPRDPQNGLEDPSIKQWCYWDGQIIKGPDGRFHMFASRWDQAKGHGGWPSSVAIHAVSEKVTGPYVDKGMTWPDNLGGKGHNVTALALPDGRYAAIVSETRPTADVFVAKSLDGPWEQLGSIKVDQPNWRPSNVSIMVRPDGDFEIVPRSGQILISKAADGILGPYKVMGPSIYPTVDQLPLRNLEDPVVWFSGGLYHIVVNGWSDRKAYHLTSKDGITNWTFRGLAYDPTQDFVHYPDGTVNHWFKMERPGVLIENGHVTAFTLASLDVEKNLELGNDIHGSKVVVIPFDGAALDRDLENAPTPPPVAVPFHPGGTGGRGGRRGGQPPATAPTPNPAAAPSTATAAQPAP